MSVIEGENSSYHKNMNPWVDFQQFIDGEPIVVLPPKDPHAEYQAYGQLEGAGRLAAENQILRSLQGAEFHSQQLECHLVSAPPGELRSCDRDLKSTLVLAEEEWLHLFRLVTGNGLMESMAKESFERNFLNKFKKSTAPLQGDNGEITTLGEFVTSWANGMPTSKRITGGGGRASHVPLQGAQRVQLQQRPVSMARLFDRIGSQGPQGQFQRARRTRSQRESAWNAAEVEVGPVTGWEAQERSPNTSNL